MGRRLLEVVDPETADAEEQRRLDREESAARASASFTINDTGDGMLNGRFTIPALQGSMLMKHLHALASPKRHPDRPREVPTRHRLGEAFIEYVETRPDNTVPHAGGVPATVVVTMTLETLMGGLQAAGLCDGTRISASEARRLACTAGVLPAVLGGKSEVLDLGRTQRFHSRHQRVAMALRDGGCSAADCDRPPASCHAHHDIPWSKDGNTDVKTGRLLCQRHHTLAHDDRYQLKTGPNRKVTFSRRE